MAHFDCIYGSVHMYQLAQIVMTWQRGNFPNWHLPGSVSWQAA